MTKLERLKKQAEEYQKFMKRVEALAEKTYSKTNDSAVNAAKETTKELKQQSNERQSHEVKVNSQIYDSHSKTEKMLAELRKNGITDYQTLKTKEFNDLKVQLAAGIISNEQYYSELATLRDAYFKEGTDEWTKYTLQIIDYNNSVVEESLKSVNDGYDSLFSELVKKHKSLQQKLEGISPVYNKISGKDEKGEYSWIQLSDIDTELSALKNYSQNLTAARDRIYEIFDSFGFDEKKTSSLKSDFLEILANMNVNDATGFSKYLTALPYDKLYDYLFKWSEKTELSKKIPLDIFGKETNNLVENYASDMYSTFSSALVDKFGSIPENFFQNGSAAASGFKDGFINSLDGIMNEISTEINQRITSLLPEISLSGGQQVTNYSNYNVYGASEPHQTVLELYKEETKKRMLLGG